MSHYARLKVTEDAPAEVIRAAYRVLAAKYHPDRQVTPEVDAVQAHAEMSALNTAYKVLINGQTRQEYDRLLAARRSLSKGRAAKRQDDADDLIIRVATPEPVVTKVDMEWAPPKTEAPVPMWNQSRRTLLLLGGGAGVVLFGLIYWVSQMLVQHQMERALSEQYAARPAVPVVAAPAIPVILPEMPGASAKRMASAEVGASAASRAAPAVTDLTHLSAEELARTLPELRSSSFKQPVAPSATARH